MDWKKNILSKRWEERYNNLSDEVKRRLKWLDEQKIKDIQLRVIKRKRDYPEIGSIFKLNPKEELYLHGIVINNHIKNNNGDDLLIVVIFREGVNIKESLSGGIKKDDLLLRPTIVGKEYWTRGYFYNIDKFETNNLVGRYGFYSIGKRIFCDEYGAKLDLEPELLGVYGVSTVYGIAMEITKELIILSEGTY